MPVFSGEIFEKIDNPIVTLTNCLYNWLRADIRSDTAMTTTDTHIPTVDRHIDETYQRLRSSLVDTAVMARGKPTFPQDLARHLKINKNLAWHVSKVIKATTPGEGIPHLPGAGGLKLFLKAAEVAGVDAEAIARVEKANEAFQEAVRLHAGDQETLELLLDGPLGGDSRDALTASRRMAYLGNSGLSGVQGRAKLTTCFVAPSLQSPEKLDTLLIGGFVDLCRLRQVEGLPLFRVRQYHADGRPVNSIESQVVLQDHGGVFSQVTPEDSSNFTIDQHDFGQTYRLGAGRVGRTGAFSTFFSKEVNGIFDRYATSEEPTGEFYSVIEVPVESLLFDLFIHRDLDFDRQIECAILARPGGGLDDHVAESRHERLPISVEPERLPGGKQTCSTEIYANYPELIRQSADGIRPIEDFACYRYVVKFPPLHSTVVLSFPLDERPD